MSMTNLQTYLTERAPSINELVPLKDINLFEDVDSWKLHELKTKNEHLFNLIKTLVNDPNIEQIDENKVFTIKMDKSGKFSITSGKNKIILENEKN